MRLKLKRLAGLLAKRANNFKFSLVIFRGGEHILLLSSGIKWILLLNVIQIDSAYVENNYLNCLASIDTADT